MIIRLFDRQNAYNMDVNSLTIGSTKGPIDAMSGNLYVTGSANVLGSIHSTGGTTADQITLSNSSTDPVMITLHNNDGVYNRTGHISYDTVGNIVNNDFNMRISATTESITPSTGCLTLDGGLGIAKNTNVGGQMKVSSTTESTDVNTGSIVTGGGIGVGGDSFFGGSMSVEDEVDITGQCTILSTISSTDIHTGSLTIGGGVGMLENLNVGGNAKINGTLTVPNIVYEDEEHITSTVDSTSISTGASVVAGGMGIAKSVNIGGPLKVLNTTQSTNSSTGSFISSGGAGIQGNLYVGGTLSASTINIQSLTISDTTQSTDTLTGCLVLGGGLGIAKNENIGGTLKVWNTTQSTDYLTGSLTTLGGMGIGGNMSLNQGSLITFNKNVIPDTRRLIISQSFPNAFQYYGLGYDTFKMILNADSPSSTFDFNQATSGSASSTVFRVGYTQSRALATTESTNVSTGAFLIDGGLGVVKNTNIGGDLTVGGQSPTIYGSTFTLKYDDSNNMSINVDQSGLVTTLSTGTLMTYGTRMQFELGAAVYGDDSSGVGNGALVVDTGLSVGQRSNFGGILKVWNNSASSSQNDGCAQFLGGLGISKNVNIGDTLRVYSTLQSSNPITGALIVDGGAGINKNLNVNGLMEVWNTSQSTSTSTGSLVALGGLGIAKDLYLGGILQAKNTTQSTDTLTGSLIAGGGVGIAKDVFVGGVLQVKSTTQSTSSSTGSAIVGGGMGIAKDLFVGGSINAANMETQVIINTIADLPPNVGGFRQFLPKKYIINSAITDTIPWQCSASNLSTDIVGSDENVVVTFNGGAGTSLFNDCQSNPLLGGWSFSNFCLVGGTGTKLFNIRGASPFIPICMKYIKVVSADTIGIFGGIGPVWLHQQGCFFTQFNQGMTFIGLDTNNRISHSTNQVAIRGAKNNPFCVFIRYQGYLDSVRHGNIDYRTSGANESILYIDPAINGVATFCNGKMDNSLGGVVFAGGSLTQTDPKVNTLLIETASVDDSGTYAYSYFSGNVTVTTGQASPPVKVAATWTNYSSERFTQSDPSGTWTYTGLQNANIRVVCNLTLDPVAASDTTWACYIYKNGAAESQILSRTTITSGDIGIISPQGIITNISTGTTIEVYIARTAGTNNVVVTDANMTIMHV